MQIELGSTLSWAWPIILSLLAMPLLSFIFGLGQFSSNTKRLVVVGVALVLGSLYAVASGLIQGVPPNVSDLVTQVLITAATILVVTQAVYNFLKPVLDTIESATSGTPKEVTSNEQAAQEGPSGS